MIALILSIVSSASMTLVLKFFRAQKGNRYGILLGNYLTCILIAFLSLPEKSLLWTGKASTVWLGAVGGVFFLAALVAMQSSVRVNGATLTAAFAKLGLLVSLLISIIWFGERPALTQLIGILMVLAAIYVIQFGSREDGKPAGIASLPLLLLTLAVGGGGDAMAKVFERFGTPGEDVLYILWVFLTACVLAAVLAVPEYRRTGKRIVPKELAAGILVGIPNYYSSYLLLAALRKLPALVV